MHSVEADVKDSCDHSKTSRIRLVRHTVPHEPDEAGPAEDLRNRPEGDERLLEVRSSLGDNLRNCNQDKEDETEADEWEVPDDFFTAHASFDDVVAIDTGEAEVWGTIACYTWADTVGASQFFRLDHLFRALGQALKLVEESLNSSLIARAAL